MNLYRVTLRAMTSTSMGTQTAFGVAYVAAKDAGAAYKKLLRAIEARGIGTSSDHVLDKVELLAEGMDYPNCGYIFYG